MLIDIAAPCSLPLGLVRLEHGGAVRAAMIGITLQHPPVSLSARPAAGLHVTGARADRAYAQAGRFLRYHHMEPGADVEIELAIPAFVGLGSEAMLGLSVARALAGLSQLPLDDTAALAQALDLGPEHALEVWGFDQGGFLLVEAQAAPGAMPALIWREELAHADKDAWVVVLHFPPTAPGLPATLEADRLEQLLGAALLLSAETGRLVEEDLWPALLSDAFPAFAQTLMKIQRLNQEALARAGAPPSLTHRTQAVLDVMRDNGALAWGQSPTGLALYGLIQGASASIELRRRLAAHVGYEGGTVMAAICDNGGARHRFSD